MSGQLDATPSILAEGLETMVGCLKQGWLKLKALKMEDLWLAGWSLGLRHQLLAFDIIDLTPVPATKCMGVLLDVSFSVEAQVVYWIRFKILVLIFKVLNSLWSVYLWDRKEDCTQFTTVCWWSLTWRVFDCPQPEPGPLQPWHQLGRTPYWARPGPWRMWCNSASVWCSG